MASRLAEFRIEGLFGVYTHRIPLYVAERITIIIGPNGRGKTVCLKFIEALFHKRFQYFVDIPFQVAEFAFTSGETIRLEKKEKHDRSQSEHYPLKFTLVSADHKLTPWSPTAVDVSARRQLRRYMPGDWELVGDDIWIDQSDGEQITTAELVQRFPLPPKLIENLQQKFPEPFAKLVDGIDCHLIETQRLLVLPSGPADEDFAVSDYPRFVRRGARQSSLAIQQKAQKLRAILKDTLTAYANLSQSLDRTFPIRVFEAQGTPSSSQDVLRSELRKLDERREALMSAGILDTQHEAVTLHGGHIESGVAMALEIYVKDAVRKLDIFNELRARLDLFKQIIDKRFIDKTIYVDRENGFKIASKTGANVPLDKLSSGEQHQLILAFDLLFEVKADSLILIDEPELSLHVAWQKSFIESLRRIISLNKFDVLLATHSPAVVARHFSLVVELGPVDE